MDNKSEGPSAFAGIYMPATETTTKFALVLLALLVIAQLAGTTAGLYLDAHLARGQSDLWEYNAKHDHDTLLQIVAIGKDSAYAKAKAEDAKAEADKQIAADAMEARLKLQHEMQIQADYDAWSKFYNPKAKGTKYHVGQGR